MSDKDKALAIEFYEIFEQMMILVVRPGPGELRDANIGRFIKALETAEEL